MRTLMLAAAATALCLSAPMIAPAKADKVIIKSGHHHRDFDRPHHGVVVIKHHHHGMDRPHHGVVVHTR